MKFETALKKLKEGVPVFRHAFTITSHLEIDDSGEIVRVFKSGAVKACRIPSKALLAEDWQVYKG